MIVDWGLYVDGRRSDEQLTLREALAEADRTDGFVWIGLHEPSAEEFEDVSSAFGLHPLAVEDAIHAHQRPKLERYGQTLFMVLKPARYVDSVEVIEVDELMLFVGDTFVVTVRHGTSGALSRVRESLEADSDQLRWGPTSVLHAVVDKVVDDYAGVLRSVEVDIDEIEDAVFGEPQAGHAARIFKLKREVLGFRRALEPLAAALSELVEDPKALDYGAGAYFRDVHDHVMRAGEHLASLDALLDSVLNANVAQVGMRQNQDMRKISAWVAIVAVPTLIAGIYGMNFEHMPELQWRFGYPLALAAMAIICLTLYRLFKRREWL